MHVLWVIDSLVASGAEQALLAMAPPLREKGFELDVAYLLERPGLHREFERCGVHLISLAGPGGSAGWIERAVWALRHRRPDVVHTSLFKANAVGRIAACLTRTPVTSSLVNVTYGPEQRQTPGTRRWRDEARQLIDVATASSVVRFHAISHWVADVMAPRLRVPRSRIDVVPRGRDPAILGRRTDRRRAETRARLGLEPEIPVVLAVARQDHQKGLDVLLEALPEVLAHRPGTQLIVAGREGDQTPLLRSCVDAFDLHRAARFLGARADIPDLLSIADVFVLPSRWEGLGSVLLEAMALEAPIVASDIPPVREVVHDHVHARLVPAGRPHQLALAVAETLDDQLSATVRAAQARDRFLERFTIDAVAARMAEFLHAAA